ncbi:Hint domain-containing protein [uncultured Jannaschia sp.]|uniref:Hint domain-containing protein n=1 Tax=uncultured Jannaschia sp. TaxID=293347 RepID=UPI0026034F1A|nr:Hint domain-containing protein [uncultured Jannaschia sp.]
MTDRTRIDFNDLGAGTIVSDQYASRGVRIDSLGADGAPDGRHPVMAFDTARPTGGDRDLATPDLRKVLILSEDRDRSDPDDNADGGVIAFVFDRLAFLHSLLLLDIDAGATVELFDPDGRSLLTRDAQTGNGGRVELSLDTANVKSMTVTLNGSGAVDNLVFTAGLVSRPDGIVDGTDGGDLIAAGYVDADGDSIDGNDAFLPGERGDDDIVRAGAGDDTIRGLAGDDEIAAGAGRDVVEGGAGNDVIDGEAGADSIGGGEGDDSLLGGSGDDTVTGGVGFDTVEGGEGNDAIDGGEGSDRLFGGGGNDTLFGGIGNDLLDGGDDNDVLDGGEGRDILRGGGGDDLLSGGADADTLFGGTGNDGLAGGDGDDVLSGESGDDVLRGAAGNDRLTGGAGRDDIFGGDDRDIIFGATPGDRIDGGSGGDDYDILDLRGSDVSSISYDRGDPESGIVRFEGGGSARFEEIERVVPCFTPGTRIATERGEVAVERLRPGDRVRTRDDGLQPIRWIGHRDLSAADLAMDETLCPVRIARGALGGGLPEREMRVSPQHRVLVADGMTSLYFGIDEVLVAARHLVGRPGIAHDAAGAVSYIHLLFDRHQLVLSDGAWTESFQPGPHSLAGLASGSRVEILRLFPELARKADVYPAARPALKRREAALLRF